MNQYIAQLARMGAAEKRTIIGLMSGTSLDGLDIALCEITGSGMETEVVLKNFTTVSFEEEFKSAIREIFSKKMVDFELLCLLNPWIGEKHAAIILDTLNVWGIKPAAIDLIASHGQTVYHAPKILHGHSTFGNGTLQIGDGDHIAVKTGIITVSDFRQKHIAAGGEGAPLAVYGDYFIFSKKGEDRIMLNIGGIANYTFLPGSLDASKIFSTDTGPGNTLMDQLSQKHFDLAYDKDAAIAKQGIVNEALLAVLLAEDFFAKPFPKTTGPELFNLEYLAQAIHKSGQEGISVYDTMATLNKLTANTIVAAIKKGQEIIGNTNLSIYSSGGGMHNPLIMEQIQSQLPEACFYTTDALQIHPDAKEAVLFAVLANEHISGGAVHIGGGSAGIPAVTMGKISFPQ
jgi:anhydro-N-acetylmuramic acid kinase